MLNHGLSNITAEIVDASGARFALKYYPRDTFKKEREEIFMSLARNFAPVPTYVGGGSNYSIMSLIDGNSGAVIFSQPQEESERVGMMIGQLIARVHTVNPQSGIVGFLSHRGNMIEEYGQRISTTRSNTTLLRSLIREQLAKLSQYNIQLPVIPIDSYICEKDDECVLVHHDVCPKNMLFRDGALVGMLDFEYALAGSRLFDIAKVHVLGQYFAYHTGGMGRFLDFSAYVRGFEKGYGRAFSFTELQPFFVYVLLNYILFWISNPLADPAARERILPIHRANLERVLCGEQLIVPPFTESV
jgi:aminoglycoside phosphotransferase (APT) family kinase protein